MLRTLDDADVRGKKVLLRVDLNVPVRNGQVSDDTRIRRLAPTARELLEKGASLILLSHFGRPKGQRAVEMSLAPVAPVVAEVLETNVTFIEDCIGPVVEQAVQTLRPGQVILLENLRFHAGEEAGDMSFARFLAKLADVYVNDAFSVAHRKHASICGVANGLPAFAGRNMEAEIAALNLALSSPRHPVGAIVGGAKVSTKLAVLGNLVEKMDWIAIGGGMANTFLHALGTDVGRSLCERNMAETARTILAKADAAGCEILLPSDVVVAENLESLMAWEVRPVGAVPDNRMILDVGPDSATALIQKLKDSRTLLWNGPLGAFEYPPFDQSTVQVAQAAAELTCQKRLKTVAGGGDTTAALDHAGVTDDFFYVSTAGGAFLEWVEGKSLPGVEVLTVRST